MPYKVTLTSDPVRDFRNLDQSVKRPVAWQLRKLETVPHVGEHLGRKVHLRWKRLELCERCRKSRATLLWGAALILCGAACAAGTESGNQDQAAGQRQHAERSLAKWTRAIEQNPSDAAAWSNRSVAKWNLGDYSGALTDANRAIELKPDDALAYSNRSAIRMQAGDLDGALSDAQAAIQRDPCREAARGNLLAASVSLNRLHGKRGAFTQPSAGNWLGRGIPQRSDPRKGDKLDGSGKPGAWGSFDQSWNALMKGSYQDSVNYASAAIALDPSLDLAYVVRGMARQFLGDLAGAYRDDGEAERVRRVSAKTLPADLQWLSRAILIAFIPHTGYPPEALRNRWQGRVVVRIAASNDGTLEPTLMKSSGHPALDNDAMNSIRRSSPICLRGPLFAPSVILEIPFEYTLQRLADP